MPGDENPQSVNEYKLDRLIKDVEGLGETLQKILQAQTDEKIWRAEIEGRLSSGVERMNSLQEQVDEKVDKRLVYAAVVGAGLGGAGLVKVISALASH